MFLATVVVATRGAIPNRDIHVGQPLAMIVSQAIAYAAEPKERVLPTAVQIKFREDAKLKPGTLAVITIMTNADASHVHDSGRLQQAIESAIHQSAMFKCRTTPGSLRVVLRLGVALLTAHA